MDNRKGCDWNLIFFPKTCAYIDVFLEIPVVTGVLVTGILLLRSYGPLTGLLKMKVIFGLLAIAVNYYCAVIVILRYFGKQDVESLQHRGSQIRWAWVGIPFGVGAFYMGWRLFIANH